MLKINRGGPDLNRATFVEKTKPTDLQVQQMREKTIAFIDFSGGQTELARETGIPFHTINAWRKRGRIPQYIAAEIGKISRFREAGFSREELRPDVQWWGGGHEFSV